MTTTLTRRKRRLFGLTTAVLLAALLVGVAEGGLRLLGYGPFHVEPVNIVVEPGGRLMRAHPTLGYAHLPGTYRITVRDSLAFTVTHGPDGYRRTRPATDTMARPGGAIWLLGGSYTHGWTVADSASFPWRLQARLPRYDVVNLGVSGYGTVHGYVQLRERLAAGARPAAVVVAYASYHDARNTFTRARRKSVAYWNHLGEVRQPYATLDEGALRLHMAEVAYTPFPWMNRSAFVHTLERAYNRVEARLADSPAVTRALLAEMARLCEAAGVPLIVVGLEPDPATATTLAYARSLGLPTADVSVDRTETRYNQLPYDSHPSAAAHAVYAERLARVLEDVLGR